MKEFIHHFFFFVENINFSYESRDIPVQRHWGYYLYSLYYRLGLPPKKRIATLNELKWIYIHIEIEIYILLYRFVDGHQNRVLLNSIMHGVCWKMEHNHFINTQMILHFRYDMTNLSKFGEHIIYPFTIISFFNIQQKLPTNRKCKHFWHNLSLWYT